MSIESNLPDVVYEKIDASDPVEAVASCQHGRCLDYFKEGYIGLALCCDCGHVFTLVPWKATGEVVHGTTLTKFRAIYNTAWGFK